MGVAKTGAIVAVVGAAPVDKLAVAVMMAAAADLREAGKWDGNAAVLPWFS